MHGHSRMASYALALTVLAPSAGPPQPPQGQPPRPPAIRTGITMVPVDVRVVGRDGKPILDLKREEFTILEDGVPQSIRHFSSLAFTPDPSAALAEPILRRASGPDIRPQNRRVFLILLARGHHQGPSKYVDALAAFMERRVLPQDQVAMMAWNRATDFTTNHDLLRRTLLRYRNRHDRIETLMSEWFRDLRAVYGSREIPAHIEREIDVVFEEAGAIRARRLAPARGRDDQAIDADARRTADDLRRSQEITEKLAAGAHSVRDLSAEITASTVDFSFEEFMAQVGGSQQDLASLYAGIAYLRHLEGEKHLVLITENGIRLPRLEHEVNLARVASDARVAVDVIQTGGVVGLPRPQFVLTPGGRDIVLAPWPTRNQVFNETFAMQALRAMAETTGGQLFAFTGGDDALKRIDETLRFQYLLGFSPSGDQNGKYRRIAVRVSRPGARVIHRQGYFAADRLVPLDRREFITFSRIQAAAEYGGVIDHLKVALGRPLVTRGDDQTVSIDVTVDISAVKFTPLDGRHAAALDVALFCGDDKQNLVCESRQRVDLNLTDSLREEMLRKGASFAVRAPFKGAPRVLKVIVYDYGADLVGTASAAISR